jgi:hypothetical protein
MRVLRRLPSAAAVAIAATAAAGMALLAGCHSSPSAAPPLSTPPPAEGGAPTTSAPSASSSGSQPSEAATPAGWSCLAIGNAKLANASTPNLDFTEIQLNDGFGSTEAGTQAQLTTCATGDIDGDGPDDALAAVEITPVGEENRPWILGLWQDINGQPSFVTLLNLGDRTPVVTLHLDGASATVVWDTRGPGDPMTALTTRRTSVFKLVAGNLVEASHTDAVRPAG